MDGDFRFYFLLAGLFLIMSVRVGNIYFRYRTKYNLVYLLVISIFLALSIVSMFSQWNPLSLVGGKELKITLVAAFLLLLFIFLFYPDIKRFLDRRKMKGKTLNALEYSLLFYCLEKYDPKKINYYYQLRSESLDNNSINEIISVINTELTNNGIGADSESNEHGLQLKSLINRITELYLSSKTEK